MWSYFAIKVIRDIIGIDNRLLIILFGEVLPKEESILLASSLRDV